MAKIGNQSSPYHVWIFFEVFVRVQKPEYYDRIMLLVEEKFAEIVKVGETMKDGLKTGKIAHVAASPGSSGLLKKEKMC